MAHACLKENGIILAEIQAGLEEWVNRGHISAFGVENIIQNGSLNFGKKKMNWPDDFINKIICGDCLEVMKEMPAESIDMMITSPPYWGLRDYGFVQIFGGGKNCKHRWSLNPKEHDALRYRGHNANVGSNKNPEIHKGKEKSGGQDCIYCGAWKGQLGLEPTPEIYIKHLSEIFNEVKRVLKKEGTLWLNIGDTYGGSGCGRHDYREKGSISPMALFSEKDNPQQKIMPKCLLMIPERLAWSLIQNGWILRNKNIWYKRNSMPSSVKDRFTNKYEYVYYFVKSQRNYFDLDAVREPYTESTLIRINQNQGNPKWNGNHKRGSPMGKHTLDPKQFTHPKGKNPGDVWVIGTAPCPIKGIHFATFPEELCRKAIIPGSPENGIVLDPFAGVGTALFVAKQLRRRFIGIDIKQEYCELAEKRLAQGVL